MTAAPRASQSDAPATPLPTVGLHHLSYSVADVEGCQAFYEQVLGFQALERPAMGFPGAWLLRNGLQIHLIGGQGHQPPDERAISSRDDHIAFASDDLRAVEQALQAHGVAYRENIQGGSGLRQLFFHDPEGRTIEVAEYPPHPPFLEERSAESRGAHPA